MNFLLRATCVLLLSALCVRGAPTPWVLLQNAGFEIYSQAGDTPQARASLLWFEQLRAFFAAAGLTPKTAQRVRVIGFRGLRDYDAYRLRPTADAYYIGTESREYIVMPSLDSGKFRVAAHEYAHVVLHQQGTHLPSWLNEGLAEFFSTVTISDRGCELGGNIRAHSQTLRTHAWLPLSRLLETNLNSQSDLDQSSLLYAESWALTEMLLAAPDYHAHLPVLISSLASGKPGAAALTEAYGKSLAAITADLHRYLDNATWRPLHAPGITVGTIKAAASELSPIAAQSMLAELLLASGELDRAQKAYADLARESPHNPEISAALGTIAFRRGEPTAARLQWKLALEQGIADANLCFRYAVLAEDAGLSPAEIRSALERAITLDPTFDDARFKLALLENTAANYQSALHQLQAMQAVAPQRAFAYWIAIAFTQDQLGRHDDSQRAAQQALHFAATAEERVQATQLAYVAATELTVQFTRGSNGELQMATARAARGASGWNPFIEPQDLIRRAAGQLQTVECGGAQHQITGLSIDTAAGPLKLAIPDPQHVLIRGATEFTCGPQPYTAVTVEYAAAPDSSPNHAPAAGILRGMVIQ